MKILTVPEQMVAEEVSNFHVIDNISVSQVQEQIVEVAKARHITSTPTVTNAAPAPVVNHVASSRTVTHRALAAVIEFVAHALVIEYVAPAPSADSAAVACCAHQGTRRYRRTPVGSSHFGSNTRVCTFAPCMCGVCCVLGSLCF